MATPTPPRTRHLDAQGRPKYTNRLARETSPYLQQHAHNPVDWHPWGDDAFERARKEGKPVLLSVGYSTCHWCHVMEEESFEDEEIAAYINAHYVPIKVDREERPDVDQIYMACVQAVTGHGGWPMTVWLTPDRKPYYGGTYFPARDGDRGARVGFLTILAELRRLYDTEPERMERAALQIVDAIRARLQGAEAGDAPTEEVLHRAFSYYEQTFDPELGGMAGAPKFPATMPTRFLLRYHARFASEPARAMAELTLQKMAQGGMYDHVGGGFHRYSVDEEWLVPHFEKMLYDNALLVPAYLEAFQVTRNAFYTEVAADILDYVTREMTSPDGAFYSATDADSPNPEKGGEREEGWFFTWTPAELTQVLGAADATLVAEHYDVTPRGNFEGRSILHVVKTPEDAATRDRLAAARKKLYDARLKRPAPLRDDKLLAGWNGLMISAFAKGAQTLGATSGTDVGRRHLATAQRAARYVTTELVRDGRLLRTLRAGGEPVPAFLEDYAFVIQALLDLYEADFDLTHLKFAISLVGVVDQRFADPDHGGYFMTPDDHEALLVREKPGYDGAVPSGNSVMALNLLRLHALTGDAEYAQMAESTLRAFHQTLARAPAALSEMLLAVDFHTATPKQIVLVSEDGLDQTAPFLRRLHQTFVPNRIVAATGQEARAEADRLIPLFRGRPGGPGGAAMAYVCEHEACKVPTPDPDVFATQLTRSP